MAPVPDPDDWLGKPEPLHLDGIISSADADGLHALISERDLSGLATGSFVRVARSASATASAGPTSTS